MKSPKNAALAPLVKRGSSRKAVGTPKTDKPKVKLRKLIDLPVETLPKLNMLAAAEGKSLKAYIEGLAIEKAAAAKDVKDVKAVKTAIRRHTRR